MPLVHVRVLDSLVEGQGAGRVLLQSLVQVGHDAEPSGIRGHCCPPSG